MQNEDLLSVKIYTEEAGSAGFYLSVYIQHKLFVKVYMDNSYKGSYSENETYMKPRDVLKDITGILFNSALSISELIVK